MSRRFRRAAIISRLFLAAFRISLSRLLFLFEMFAIVSSPSKGVARLPLPHQVGERCRRFESDRPIRSDAAKRGSCELVECAGYWLQHLRPGRTVTREPLRDKGSLSQILGLGSLLERRIEQNSNYNCEVGAILLSRLSDVNPQNCEGFATGIKL